MKFQSLTSGAHGTSLRGYVRDTREHIESVFGEPMDYGTGGKVTTEWIIEFEDGTVATIYDWKRYEGGAPYLEESYEWHIGGANHDAVTAIESALGMRADYFKF